MSQEELNLYPRQNTTLPCDKPLFRHFSTPSRSKGCRNRSHNMSSALRCERVGVSWSLLDGWNNFALANEALLGFLGFAQTL